MEMDRFIGFENKEIFRRCVDVRVKGGSSPNVVEHLWLG